MGFFVSLRFQHCKERYLNCRIPSWNVTVMCYNVLLYYRDSPLLDNCNPWCCGVSIQYNGLSTLEDGRDSRFTAEGNNGVSTMEDGTDAELTAAGTNGASSLEDGRDTELTSVVCHGLPWRPWRVMQIPSSRR